MEFLFRRCAPSTALGRVVKEIETRPDPLTIDLGFLLLTLSEETILEVSKNMSKLVRQAQGDHKNHDLTLSINSANTGLIVHWNEDPASIAGPRL